MAKQPRPVSRTDVTRTSRCTATDATDDSTDDGDATDGSTDDGTTDEPEVPAGDASGTGTFQAGDTTIDGEVTACTLDGNDVAMNLNGENAGVEVIPLGEGEVDVVVSGMVEWEGRGQATVDGGSVSIEGSGSLTDPGADVEDFTLTAEISSC